MALNVFTFTGRIGKDAVVRFTQSGDAVTSFTAAATSGFGDKAVTTWLNCAIWGKRGESVAPYLLKGAQVAVTGELTNREYTDKDGNKRYSLDVRVNDVTLVGSKPERTEPAAPHQAAQMQQPRGVEDMDSDIPF